MSGQVKCMQTHTHTNYIKTEINEVYVLEEESHYLLTQKKHEQTQWVC